jgi:hypothetical protein
MTEKESTAAGGRSSPGQRRGSTHSAPVQDAQSYDASLEDHVYDQALEVVVPVGIYYFARHSTPVTVSPKATG